MFRNSQLEKIKRRHISIIDQGSIVNINYLSFKSKLTIKKVSKEHFIRGYYELNPKTQRNEFKSDGLVCDMKKTDGRNKKSLRKIFNDLQYLINTNFHKKNIDRQLMLTLTYAENMQDPERLYADFKAFKQRLQRKIGKFEYINIVEPQGRGAWHAHLLLKSDKTLYIHNEEMARIWRHGFTKTERLSGIDNIGAYFIAYFSNVEVTEDVKEQYELDESDIEERGPEQKKYIKGERLKFYPDYMQIWRHSRGLEMPKSEPVTKYKIKKHYADQHVRHEYKISAKEENPDDYYENIYTSITTQHREKKSS
jgi:hypothetical protein